MANSQNLTEEISLSVKEIWAASHVVSIIMDAKIPFSASYSLLGLSKQLKEVIELFDSSRKRIITDYCVLNSDGTICQDATGNIKILPEKENIFNSKVEELLNERVFIKVRKINISDLTEVKIEARNLAHIAWLLTED